MTKPLNTSHRRNRLLAALELEDFALLEPYLELVDLSFKQVLYNPGDVIRHAYFPHDAIISLVNVMEDGETVEVAIFGREGVSGVLSALATREAFGQYIVQMAGTACRSCSVSGRPRSSSPSDKQAIVDHGLIAPAQRRALPAGSDRHDLSKSCNGRSRDAVCDCFLR